MSKIDIQKMTQSMKSNEGSSACPMAFGELPFLDTTEISLPLDSDLVTKYFASHLTRQAKPFEFVVGPWKW